MASEAPERGASSALLVLIADLVAASGETARGLHRVLPSETVRVRIASIGVGEETVETRIRVCWTRRSPRDACEGSFFFSSHSPVAPQVDWQLERDWKLFALPPHPEYMKELHWPVEES